MILHHSLTKGRIAPQDKLPPLVARDYNQSPQYMILNIQRTKKFKRFDLNVGVENITNYVQKDPVTESFMPYNTYFDTTNCLGPLMGRVEYVGLRLAVR